ncbi:MAG: TonB-dependent receptor [Burkholderiales bacterium]
MSSNFNSISLLVCAQAVAAVLLPAASPAIAQIRLPEVRVEDTRPTPLNTDAPADSASRLGLKVREVPATVEVIDQETMKARGYRTVSEAAAGAVGVTVGDFPAEPANFSMRGFTNSHLNTLYNGIKIGPPNMTSRVMDTGNLERIEFMKGPASLMSGEGAAGGAINFVTKRPHTGAIENEAYLSYGSFNTVRAGFGSGGSTSMQGLDYRFDLNRSSSNGFIDNTKSESWHLSTGLDYRVSSSLKLFGAFEYKQDRASAYWGTPLVASASSGGNAKGGIVAGNYVNTNGINLGAITIDNRTLTANYNVADNRNRANEYWLRGGFEWNLNNNVTLRNHAYAYTAQREFLNSEVYAFNPGTGLVDRDRFYVAHDQKLYGNKTELQWDGKVAGMDNRAVVAFEISHLDFNRPGAANFPGDSVTLVNPSQGTYGPLILQQQTARINNSVLAIEDRLKFTPAVSLIGGLRYEEIAIDRTSISAAGANRAGFPFSRTFTPTTGRVGLTWEAVPGMTLYGQYATAADVAAGILFLLNPGQPLALTTARTYETGVKQLFWERKAEWSLALYDIERKNVYSAQASQTLAVAGKQRSNGVELAAAARPTPQWNVWGNIAYTHAYYDNFVLAAGGSFAGNTPPNVPKVVANAGASYRIATSVPVEVGTSVRHVGDRFNADANTVTLLAYTVADAYAFVDIRKKTRLTFRVRNLTDKKYAIWGDPFYPDQILLGAPRSYELSAAIKF